MSQLVTLTPDTCKTQTAYAIWLSLPLVGPRHGLIFAHARYLVDAWEGDARFVRVEKGGTVWERGEVIPSLFLSKKLKCH